MKIDLNSYKEFLIAQKMLALGNKYLVTDISNNVLLYSKQKLFKLKEDFRFYYDQGEKEEALVIRAENIIDFSGKYDVIDPINGSTIGKIKREGLSSLVRGKWKVISPSDEEIAEVSEDSTLLAILRRFFDVISYFIPVEFTIRKGETVLGSIKKKRALIRDRYYLDMRQDSSSQIDRRLTIALAILLDSINNQ